MQTSIFDQAEKNKLYGMSVAYAGANSIWRRAAADALRKCAETMPEFTSDDVWPLLAVQGIHTGNNSAIGAVFKAGAMSGLIRKTGNYIESNRPSAHKRPIAIWQSMVYHPPKEYGDSY